MQTWQQQKEQYGDTHKGVMAAWSAAIEAKDLVAERIAKERVDMWEAFFFRGDGFRHALYRAITKADGENLSKLRLGFPVEVAVYEDYAFNFNSLDEIASLV